MSPNIHNIIIDFGSTGSVKLVKSTATCMAKEWDMEKVVVKHKDISSMVGIIERSD
jgi:hypothetical protein